MWTFWQPSQHPPRERELSVCPQHISSTSFSLARVPSTKMERAVMSPVQHRPGIPAHTPHSFLMTSFKPRVENVFVNFVLPTVTLTVTPSNFLLVAFYHLYSFVRLSSFSQVEDVLLHFIMSLLSVKLCKQDCGVFVTEVSVGKVSKLISWVNFFPCKSQQAANIRSSRCYSVPELDEGCGDTAATTAAYLHENFTDYCFNFTVGESG